MKLEGYDVRSAASFAEALQMAESWREGEIIVADYHLDSSHTGLDVLRNARASCGFPVPGVILSGDLPSLFVDADGKAEQPVLAPRLKSPEELKGHALMVHAGGDNHADHPKPLGGGGARVACGVIR